MIKFTINYSIAAKLFDKERYYTNSFNDGELLTFIFFCFKKEMQEWLDMNGINVSFVQTTNQTNNENPYKILIKRSLWFEFDTEADFVSFSLRWL